MIVSTFACTAGFNYIAILVFIPTYLAMILYVAILEKIACYAVSRNTFKHFLLQVRYFIGNKVSVVDT